MKPTVLSAAKTLSLQIEAIEKEPTPRILPRAEADTLLEARQVLEKAHELLDDAKAESTRAREEARQIGYEEGLEQAAGALVNVDLPDEARDLAAYLAPHTEVSLLVTGLVSHVDLTELSLLEVLRAAVVLTRLRRL